MLQYHTRVARCGSLIRYLRLADHLADHFSVSGAVSLIECTAGHSMPVLGAKAVPYRWGFGCGSISTIMVVYPFNFQPVQTTYDIATATSHSLSGPCTTSRCLIFLFNDVVNYYQRTGIRRKSNFLFPWNRAAMLFKENVPWTTHIGTILTVHSMTIVYEVTLDDLCILNDMTYPYH
jgi:hypothetical protein